MELLSSLLILKKVNFISYKYGLKQLFKIFITVLLIFVKSFTKFEDPLPYCPHNLINSLSKSFPIPIEWILNKLELSLIKSKHSFLSSTSPSVNNNIFFLKLIFS